jgi:hypothetical protein
LHAGTAIACISRCQRSLASIEAFLWGLLPDNEIVLQRWGRQFGVSPRNAFALIREVGEDCAGAVQFVAEERLQDVGTGKLDGVAWLTKDDVAAGWFDWRRSMTSPPLWSIRISIRCAYGWR